MNDPIIEYVEDNCYRWTFDAKKVKSYVENNVKGEVLNLFAGKNKLNCREIRVDSSKEFHPQYHMNAEYFLAVAKERYYRFDTIIYDPPWNERKAKEKYNGKYIGRFTKLKDDIVSLLRTHGRIISAGYTITNFGKVRGMKITKLLVVNPHGEIRPYFISIEEKI